MVFLRRCKGNTTELVHKGGRGEGSLKRVTALYGPNSQSSIGRAPYCCNRFQLRVQCRGRTILRFLNLQCFDDLSTIFNIAEVFVMILKRLKAYCENCTEPDRNPVGEHIWGHCNSFSFAFVKCTFQLDCKDRYERRRLSQMQLKIRRPFVNMLWHKHIIFIPDICLFWGTITLFRPVKGAPKRA